MIFNFRVYILIGKFGIVQEKEIALYVVLLENAVHGVLVATGDFDIVNKQATLPFYKSAINVIGIIGNEVYALFVAHIAIILHVCLIAVYFGSYARFAVVLKKKVVQFFLKIMTQIVGCSRNCVIRTWQKHNFILC